MNKALLIQLLSITLILGLISVNLTPQNVNAEVTTPQTIITTDQMPADTRAVSMGPATEADKSGSSGASGDSPFSTAVTPIVTVDQALEDTQPVSIGPAPDNAKSGGISASGYNPLMGIFSGVAAFALEIFPGENLVHFPDTTLPGTWNIIASLSGTDLYAGDFVGGDFETLYTVDYTTNALIGVDTSSGAKTVIGTTTPPTGHTFTGLSGAPNGTMFGLTTNLSATNLVVVDITTGATTNLGALTGIAGGIDLAYNTDDGMIYIVDILSDDLFKVNPDTLNVTLVGDTGVAANFAQGMDYEEVSGVLYWAAYTSSGELRTLDTATGLSTLVGAFPGGVEVDCLAFPTGGIPDGKPAFAINTFPDKNLVHFPNTNVPGTWDVIASISGNDLYAGDFVGGNFKTLYTVDFNTNELIGVDTATGAKTVIGTTTPPTGQKFTGLSGTPNGTMFGLTTSCVATNLVTVDITSGVTTDLGALPGIACGIDLAFNTDDSMIYIVDIMTDDLFKVNPERLNVTLVGDTGVLANFAQGMDYEEVSGVLYWAAYTTSGQLRVLDTATGLSTLVGAFPGGVEVDCLALLPIRELFLPVILR